VVWPSRGRRRGGEALSTVSFTTIRATRKPNTSAATTIQIDAFCSSGGGRGVSPQASFGLPTRPKGQRCSKPNTAACLASAPALPHPSGKKQLDVVQHYLVVVGFREDRTVLTKLTRSMGCALRGASKDNVQLRPH
jgi:hypothetical protein